MGRDLDAYNQWCWKIADAIAQQATNEWKNMSEFRVPTISGEVPAMGIKPIKIILRRLKKKGCEFRINSSGELNFDFRRKG